MQPLTACRLFLPVCLVILVSFLLTISDENIHNLLMYDRLSVLNGEVWRVVTAHLVHADVTHWLMNISMLIVLSILFPAELAGWWTGGLLFLSGLGVSVGVLLIFPQLHWFVGLSGVLHSLFAFCALRTLKKNEKFGAWLMVLLAGKLVYEWCFGPLPGSQELIGVFVVTDTHLIGALTGSAIWIALQMFNVNRANCV